MSNSNVNNLVNEVLHSPSMRTAIENCIRIYENNATNNTTSSPNLVMSTAPTSMPLTTPANFTSVKNEVRRIFPSIRRPGTDETRRLFPTIHSTQLGQSNSSRMRYSRNTKKQNTSFCKDVILLKRSGERKTLIGYSKAMAYEQGFALPSVEFDKNFSCDDVRSRILDHFRGN